jgi:hypothetical protein
VNDDLEELDFAFYDPRISSIYFFTITLRRSECLAEIKEAKDKAEQFVKEINEALSKII